MTPGNRARSEITCPHCDSRPDLERLTETRYLCLVCAREFDVAAPPRLNGRMDVSGFVGGSPEE